MSDIDSGTEQLTSTDKLLLQEQGTLNSDTEASYAHLKKEQIDSPALSSSDSIDEYGNAATPGEPAPVVDEYGNAPKYETENFAIRERLRSQAESMTRKHKEEIDNLKKHYETIAQSSISSSGDEEWRKQFDSAVKEVILQQQREMQQMQYQEQEDKLNRQFEEKFSRGMSRYNDFENVVVGKPLTASMILATRALSDPSAFIYAAAKTQAAELERISQIGDPTTQAVEIGKLEERMKRSKQNVTKASAPISNVKGDYTEDESKNPRHMSLEDKIRQDAEYLNSRRR